MASQPSDHTTDPGGRVTVAAPAARRETAPPPTARAPLVVAAGVNALWAAMLSFLPMLGTVAAVTLIGPSRPPLGDTIRFGTGAFLLAHGVPLVLAGEPITLVPLAVSALAAWRCALAGRNTIRAIGARGSRSPRSALFVAATIATVYGGIGALLAAVIGRADLRVGVLRAGLTLGAFAGIAALAGGLRASGVAGPNSPAQPRWLAWVPAVVRDAARTGAVAALVLIAAGAVATGASIAVAGGAATTMLAGMHLGIAAEAGIVLVCLAYAPDVSVWAAAFLTGPGFTLARVPELPIFAGFPARPVTGAWQALLATPVLAGCVAGLLLARRHRRRAVEVAALRSLGRAPAPSPDDRSRWSALGAALLAAPFAGVLLALAGYLAAGALGSGPLRSTGQVGWQFAAIGAIGIGFGAAIAVAVVTALQKDRGV
jgi:hypothetical protein